MSASSVVTMGISICAVSSATLCSSITAALAFGLLLLQLASPTPRSHILVSSMQMLLTNPAPVFPCLLTTTKRTMDSIAHISCTPSPSPISAFESFSQPLNPLTALSSSNLSSSDGGSVFRTEEQMHRAELVSKYNLASLKVSEFEIECFIYSLTVIILVVILCVLLVLKVKETLHMVVEKFGIWKSGEELFKFALEALPLRLLFVLNTLVGTYTGLLINVNSTWHKKVAAEEEQKLAKLKFA